ncbi:hypothetical protein MKX50_14050 [Paenibacillus sp. FSL W8-0186]|uniref:hypothetical protein n=1 Tax=Paenibacillus sp. FSL W8-0186 TaxID=2921709 RepID=UPI0030D10A59
MYKAAIDEENYLAVLEPRHAKELLYQLIDSSRENIGRWLTFPTITNKVEDSLTFIEKSLKDYPKIMDIGLAFGIKEQLQALSDFYIYGLEGKKNRDRILVGR